MRSRSSMPSCASSSEDLMLAVSRGLTLQICLIIALSFLCRHGALHSAHKSCTPSHMSWKVAGRQNWYQLLELLPGSFHTYIVVQSSQQPATEHVSQVAKGSYMYHLQLVRADLNFPLRGVQFPGIVYTCNQGPLSSA